MEFEDIKCCANNCESTANGEISFFRFPPDRERCDYWLTVIGRDDLKDSPVEILSSSYFVCSLHFDESYLKDVDDALTEETHEIQVDADNTKELLEVASEDMGSFIVHSRNLVYLQGSNMLNVKSEDIQYDIQQESGDIMIYDDSTTVVNDEDSKHMIDKNGDEILSVFNAQVVDQNGLLDGDVKTEKVEHSYEGSEDEDEEENATCLCDACGQPFASLDSLRLHFSRGCPGVKIEDTANDFKCALCDMSFTMFDQMKAHIRKLHMQSRSYTCDVCGTAFGHRSNLSRHKLQHCSAKKFQCDQCGRGFSQRSNLISHQATFHMIEPKHSVNEVLSRPGAERIHRKPKKHRCHECGKLFVSLTGLKNHGAIHSGHRPYICAICQKTFTLMSCLKTHMNTIHSDKKHYCELCGKSYQSEHYLKTHLRIHSGAKDYICEHCLKGFIDQPSLKLHMRTHTGEKPFTCKICARSFTQQSHLKTHHRIHTGEKPFKCEVCGKMFRQLSNVLEHSRTHKK